ncbi:adhesin isopeptide-forming domain-containing protein, sspB-C2 type [Plantibacter flavus]|uniref:Adhesin isopeptide-forming family sspB-C2 type protein n=1 Tax=Plantibacter flavus TaxID=150123 RepID=A0A3N2BLE6_9MICO|nr:LPXTG cell wall anchor domain-containing protein [Plantibacter flavus]ROR76079.1 adhesin isopeptide-forming family sspB-C2 type protein [Plantibacter flavus]SMG48804.1 adhesin isopeptide-forming domain-containing protein, sspB-C2 type [Plantibacter flavus]
MRNQKLGAADSSSRRGALRRVAKGGARAALAGALALGLAVTGSVSAFAADGIGGGGVGGGGGSGGIASEYWLYTGDTFVNGSPAQGWGQTSIDTFATAMESQGGWATGVGGNRTGINQACGTAINQAIARSNGAASQARVIQVGVALDWSGGTAWMGWGGNQGAMAAWYQGLTERSYWQAMLPAYDASAQAAVYNTFMANIPPNPRIVCVALNNIEAVPEYDLAVSTDKVGAFALAGTTTTVRDTINTSTSSSIRENITATVRLNWGGVEGTRKSATKNVVVSNSGSTLSPTFAPADLGWTSWPSGKFWFDVSITKQGKMKAAVSHAGENDARENWAVGPVAPTKQLTSGNPADPLKNAEVLASGMFYNAEITASTNGFTSSMSITDTIGTDKVWIGSQTADVPSAAYMVDPNGAKVAGATVTVTRSGGKVIVEGTVTNIPDTFQSRQYKLIVPTFVLPTETDYMVADDSKVCYTAAKNSCAAGNSAQIRKVTPKPDKVWLLDPEGGLTTSDPGQTNQQGADNKVFLMGDEVSAVVNGRIPANLAENLSTYKIIDDWTQAGQYVDFSDKSLAKVYAETAPGSGSWVSVTNQFDIDITGTVTTATAKASYLAATKGLSADRKIKLIVSGAFRTDFDTAGEVVSLVNAGSEVWNNETIETNEPPVYTWTPNPNKQVLGSGDESGDSTHGDINGSTVWPGQKLEYSIGVDLRVPAGTARGIKSLAVEDVYDPYFTPDKGSIEFWDSRDTANPKPIPRSQYTLVVDEEKHMFTATFTDEWLANNVSTSGANSEWLTQGWLTLRFTGTVKKDIAEGSTVVNQAFQIVNDARTGTEIPTVEIPTQTPDKESLSSEQNDIDGKTVVKGDVILYRLTLDANPGRDQLAYNVHKLGMVDDFDEDFLTLDPAAIRVTEKTTGADVTAQFNVQVIDGVAYVFAKQTDTTSIFGGTIAGDPQPADLAAYDQAPILPLEHPIIDQSLLGKQYWITLPTVVTKEQDGYVIENQARQNIQNTYKATKIVSNPLKEIDPSKDVVISDDGEETSVDATEIPMYSEFNYRLNSSEIPGNRAYAASQWSMSDTFDRAHDEYTGVWAIYANADVYDGTTLLAAAGELLQDSAGREGAALKGLFDVTFDESSYTLSVTATQKFLDLVQTRSDLAAAFSVYTKMVRIAPSDRVENTVSESYNDVLRESNTVWTNTIEHPSVEVKKFTLDEGEQEGDRNDVDEAYPLSKEQLADEVLPEDAAADAVAKQHGVEVGIRFSNTGDVPLTNVQFADMTHDGRYGDVEGLVCAIPDNAAPGIPGIIQGNEAVGADEDGLVWVLPSAITELKVKQTVDCKGTLRGMEPGMVHGDTVVVTADSIFSATTVKAEDAWFAAAASAPALEIVKYTLSEGRDAGDRNESKNALVLTHDQAKNGVQIAFDVTNTGDERLTITGFEDLTDESMTGKVEDIHWLDPVPEATDAASDPVTTDDTTETEPSSGEGSSEPAKPVTVEIAGQRYLARPISELVTLAAGQKALLVGTLTGVEPGTSHADTATVTSVGAYSGTEVVDNDSWNASLPAIPPMGGAVTGDPLSLASSRLWLFGGAGALLLAAAVLGWGIRRQEMQARETGR